MKEHASLFLKLVLDAKSRIKEISPTKLKEKMKGKDDFYLIDVREDSEWEQGHIPGAIHLSKGIIERDIEKKIPNPAAKLVLYCGGGFRSALAADNIQKMGFSQVYSLEDGFKGWAESNYPIEK